MERRSVFLEAKSAILASKKEPHFVYFVGCREFSLVKIGFAKDPNRRLLSNQTGSPVKLEILALVSGDKQLEAKLHSLFEADRELGEWFRRGDDLDRLVSFAAEQQTAFDSKEQDRMDKAVQRIW